MKKEMKLGVYIESGLQDWQVIQQKDGVGAAELYGKYYKEQNREACEIWSRLASEITGESIIPWKKARILDDEKWMIILEGIPAGGPYRVETCMKNGTASSFQEALRGDMIHQVYVGDLFVIAGQSNAAGYGKDPVEDGPELGVSLFGQRGIWELASHPLNDSTDSIYEQITERMNPGRSPYLHFAKYYKRISGIPVGLIQTALGASPVSRWNPEDNGDLYQNMKEMLKKASDGRIAGMLWYQGCAEAVALETEHYGKRFSQMIKSFWEEFGRIPVFACQIGRLTGNISEASDRAWNQIREAQKRVAAELDGIYLIPTLDAELSDQIHISSLSGLKIGERLARAALCILKSRPFHWQAPEIAEACLCGKNLKLTFDHVGEELFSMGADANDNGFRAEDDRGRILFEEYSCSGNIIFLRLERKPEGKCLISFGYGQDPKGVFPVDTGNHYPPAAFWRMPVEGCMEGNAYEI